MYAIPRKLKKPIMSVIMVIKIEEQRAGSILNLLTIRGVIVPTIPPVFKFIKIASPKLKLNKWFW